MFEKMDAKGYDLYEAFTDQWVIDLKNGQAFHGTFKEVAKAMVGQLGFEANEIEDAVTYMTKLGHNAAHFGTFQRFIFSFNKEVDNEKAS